MCIQDVRLGRAKAAVNHPDGADVTVEGVQLLAANPRRAMIAFSLVSQPNSVDPQVVMIRAENAAGPLIGVLTGSHPHARFSVEDFGTAILGRIWANAGAVSEHSVGWADIVWLTDPEAV